MVYFFILIFHRVLSEYLQCLRSHPACPRLCWCNDICWWLQTFSASPGSFIPCHKRSSYVLLCFGVVSLFFLFVCFRLSIEPWSSIYVKRSNYAPSEQAQEVKVTDPPKQSTEPNAARRLLGGSCKSPCATVKKGRGGFHRNGRVCVIISYGIAAKCRAKKSISSGRHPAVSGNDNLRSASGWQRHVLDTGQQQRATQTHRPSDPNSLGSRAHRPENTSPFSCRGAPLMCIPS